MDTILRSSSVHIVDTGLRQLLVSFCLYNVTGAELILYISIENPPKFVSMCLSFMSGTSVILILLTVILFIISSGLTDIYHAQ